LAQPAVAAGATPRHVGLGAADTVHTANANTSKHLVIILQGVIIIF
jgi:hypothetical protein